MFSFPQNEMWADLAWVLIPLHWFLFPFIVWATSTLVHSPHFLYHRPHGPISINGFWQEKVLRTPLMLSPISLCIIIPSLPAYPLSSDQYVCGRRGPPPLKAYAAEALP